MCKILLAISIVCCFAATTQADIYALGDLPGGSFRSVASSVSADGLFVVGQGAYPWDGEAFRWTQSGGMVGLGFLPGDFRSGSNDTSADGTVVVGYSDDGGNREAFRWTENEGMISLGDLAGGGVDSLANGASADGSVVVGRGTNVNGFEAFLWTQSGGMVSLGEESQEARDVSADGSVIVGYSLDYEAFRWTQSSGLVGLGYLPGGDFHSFANAVSADGSVIVGKGRGANSFEAFRWTQSGGMVGLGMLPGGTGSESSTASGVSADGSVVVGSVGSRKAFVWTVSSGMVNLFDFLIAQGDDLSHWTSLSASGVSADGRTIVGRGININGDDEAFIATLDSLPGPPIVIPDSFSVTRGEYVSGGLPELAGSNNADLSIRRAAADIQSRTEFEVTAVSPTPSPSSLEVTLEGSVFARSDVNQTIELYDYVANDWEQIDTRPATRFTDSTVTVAATGDLSRFIESGIGQISNIRARVRYQSTNPRQRFASNTDQFVWIIGL